MPNDIPQRQNEPEFTNLLAVYSRAYDISARFGAWQIGLAVVGAVAIPAVNALVPSFRPWGAVFGVAVLLLDLLLLEPAVKRYHELGATMQELFDTRLLGIPWNDIRAGSEPDAETVAGLTKAPMDAHAHDQDRLDRLRNWYPVAVGRLPLEYGRLVCQRASMWWDADLRRQYRRWFYIPLIWLLVAGGFAYGLVLGMSLDQFVMAVMAPLAPVGVKLCRGYQKHAELIAATDRVRMALDSTWAQAMIGILPAPVLETHARRVQDELLDRRRAPCRVPGWFYRLSRAELEYQTEQGAEAMVRAATAKLGLEAASGN